MKKGLILSRKSDLHSIQRFFAEAKTLDLELAVKGPKEILDSPPRSDEFDFVIPRFGTFMLEESISALRLLEDLGLPTLNSSYEISVVKDKWQFYQWCNFKALPTPKSTLHFADLSFPMVQKPRWGSKGEMVHLIRSQDQIQKLSPPTFFQEFIAEANGQDIRVLSLGCKVVGHYKRIAPPGDFRSNLAIGGTPKSIDLPREVEEFALKAAHQLPRLGLIGFDFLQSHRGPLLLEANTSPGFAGIEALDQQINMARIILEYALKI